MLGEIINKLAGTYSESTETFLQIAGRNQEW